MGRYGDRAGEPRTERLVVRMTPGELDALREAAENHGYTMGAYIRIAAATVFSDDELRDEHAEERELAAEIRGMRGDLGRLGNNVNQIARELNATGVTSDAGGWAAVLRALMTMQDTLLKLSEKGGK